MSKKMLISLIGIFVLLTVILTAEEIAKKASFIIKNGKTTEKKAEAVVKNDKMYVDSKNLKEVFGFELKKPTPNIIIACTPETCYTFMLSEKNEQAYEANGKLYVSVKDFASNAGLKVDKFDTKEMKVEFSKNTPGGTKSDDTKTSESKKAEKLSKH